MNRMKDGWYDLHCHLLPGMDDGCKTCEESIAVLRRSVQQGVCGMMATPHYYPVESVERFLQRRQQAFRRLQDVLKKQQMPEQPEQPLPRLCLGAEVAYHPGLVCEEQLRQLCLGQSSYMLLELPFERWSPRVLRDVQTLQRVHGITPVIAHLERYRSIEEKAVLQELLEMDVLIQMNAETFHGLWSGLAARKALKRRRVQVLGSDCHNLTSRPPNLGSTVLQLERSGLGQCLEPVRCMGRRIFEDAAAKDEVIEHE